MNSITKHVFFHDDNDGYCGAAVAFMTTEWKGAIFTPVQYGKPVPDVKLDKDTQVLIIDFSYPRETTIRLKEQVGSLVILDHHKSAQTELEGLDYAIFDMNESGASLAWKYFHGDALQPSVVKYTTDRDLWKHEYPESNYFYHGIIGSGKSNDMETWINLVRCDKQTAEVVHNGKVLSQAVSNKCLEFAAERKFQVRACGIDNTVHAAIYNCTEYISEKAHAVYSAHNDVEFVMSYFVLPTNEFVFSLRSAEKSKLDLGQLAKRFKGGGGHFHAAGFKLNMREATEFLSVMVHDIQHHFDSIVDNLVKDYEHY